METVQTTSRAAADILWTLSRSDPCMKALAEDYISPELVRVTTPRYQPMERGFSPRLGTYQYSVKWEGIPAATCSATVGINDGRFFVETSARTHSAIDLAYKLRFSARSVLDSAALAPYHLDIEHRENARLRFVEVAFSHDTGEITASNGKTRDDPDKKIVSFSSRNFTLDPIGAVFLARSLDWKVGDSRSFDVFNGRSRYFVTLSTIDKATIEHDGTEREAFVLSPLVRNLTSAQAVDKLKTARIYLSADEHRDVLRIVSNVFIGSVITELETFIPTATDDGQARAVALNHTSWPAQQERPAI